MIKTPYQDIKNALVKNVQELLKIKEYPDVKSNTAMRVAVMNAEAVTIQAVMALVTREDTMLACTKVAEDILEGMNKMRGESKCDS